MYIFLYTSVLNKCSIHQSIAWLLSKVQWTAQRTHANDGTTSDADTKRMSENEWESVKDSAWYRIFWKIVRVAHHSLAWPTRPLASSSYRTERSPWLSPKNSFSLMCCFAAIAILTQCCCCCCCGRCFCYTWFYFMFSSTPHRRNGLLLRSSCSSTTLFSSATLTHPPCCECVGGVEETHTKNGYVLDSGIIDGVYGFA